MQPGHGKEQHKTNKAYYFKFHGVSHKVTVASADSQCEWQVQEPMEAADCPGEGA